MHFTQILLWLSYYLCGHIYSSLQLISSLYVQVTKHALTSLLATLLIMILSGRSMVLAMVSTTRRAWRRVGQSNRLYITFCFLVQSRSSYTAATERVR